MNHAILIPKLNENDDEVVILELYVKEGDCIKVGQTLLEVETSKAVVEIEAESSGYIHWQVSKKDRVAILSTVAILFPTQEDWSANKSTHNDQSSSDSVSAINVESKSEAKVKASKSALHLARQHDIEITSIHKKGFIRERDILDYIENNKLAKLSTIQTKEKEDSAKKTDKFVGKLLTEFYQQLITSPEQIAKLPSDEKIEIYRQNGAVIGPNVTIGKGTMIQAEYVSIGADTILDEDILIKCRCFKIGELGQIGKNCKFLCRDFIAGDVVTMRWNVAVVDGQGGIYDCEIGDLSFIAYDTYINTDRSVSLGERVCLSPGVRIYTHRKWLDYSDGYPCSCQPVTINQKCWLGPASMVLPGVILNSEVTVMPNSVVVNDAPQEALLGGIPAKIIKKKQKEKLTLEQQYSRIIEIFEDNTEALKKIGWIIQSSTNPNYIWSGYITNKKDKCLVIVTDNLAKIIKSTNQRIIFLTLKNKSGIDVRDNITVFDLSNKTAVGKRDYASDAIRYSLFNYGICLEPHLWRYNVGMHKKSY